MEYHVSTLSYMELHGVLCVSTCESISAFMRFDVIPWSYMELHGFPYTSMWISMEIQLYFDSPFSLQPLISAL